MLCLVYFQENLGWGLGYGIPTIGLLLSLVAFYFGTPYYRHKLRKSKHPVKNLIRVPVVAFTNRSLELPSNPSELYVVEPQQYMITGNRRILHTSAFSWLDKAAVREASMEGTSRLHPCTLTQVEEAKIVLGMILMWLLTLIPCMIWAQETTLFVKQGTTMDRFVGHNFKIPSASLGSFSTLSMLIVVPFYDRYFVPFMRRRTKNPRGISLLQRLGIGFVLQIIVVLDCYYAFIIVIYIQGNQWYR